MPRAVPAPRLGRREQTKVRNRSVLLAAARKVFIEIGFEAATVRDIVRASGLAVGTFYEYFRDKEEAFSAVAREAAAELRRRVRAERRARSVPFEDRVYRAYLAYFRFACEDRALFELLDRNAFALRDGLAPDLAIAVRELREDLFAETPEALGGLDADYVAVAMIGLASLVGRRMLSRPDPSPEEAARFCTRFALEGLTGASTSQRRRRTA